jgi:hypothetical protein
VDVDITGTPRGIHYSPQYFVLKFLCPLDDTLTGTTPQMHSIRPDQFYDLVVLKVEGARLLLPVYFAYKGVSSCRMSELMTSVYT